MSSRLFGRRRALGKRVFLCRLSRGFSSGFAAVVLIVTACENAETRLASEPAARPSISQYLTGEAAHALLPNGELRLAPGESPDGTPIITASRAIELANAYVRTYGYSFKPMWERQRGGRINLATIAAAPRAYFAQTPYGPFPEGFHPAFKRWYGPWYHITLTSGGLPVVQMAVSAYLTDYKVDETGRLVLPILSGNDFVHIGISSESDGFAPLGPEEAVARVAEASGARIDRAPELVRRGGFSSPLFAAWQLGLDRSASLGVTPNGRETRVLFVGLMGRRNFLVAAPDQPAFDRDVGRRVSNRGEPLTVDHFQVAVRSGRVVKFEDARLTGAGGVP
jgi:hypothetical protein